MNETEVKMNKPLYLGLSTLGKQCIHLKGQHYSAQCK